MSTPPLEPWNAGTRNLFHVSPIRCRSRLARLVDRLRVRLTSYSVNHRARLSHARRRADGVRILRHDGVRQVGRARFQRTVQADRDQRQGGATIQKIESLVNGTVTHNTGPSCWNGPVRVAPGATLDVFDSGWDSLGNCAPSFSGHSNAARVTIVVTFSDDEGRSGSVEATTTLR
jgi:hypothetical protein